MRLLNIMLAKVKGGVETMALRYHEALTAEGYDVLSLGHPDGMLAEALGPKGFQPLVANNFFDPKAALMLRAYNRDFQPHMVLTHGNRATGLSLMPMIGTRNKTVQVLHNPYFKSHFKKVSNALCVSTSIRNAALQAHPDLNAIDMANFAALTTSPVKAAPSARPVVGVLGRLHTQKGFDILLNAMGLLRQRGLDFLVKVGGDGHELAALQQQARDLGLENNVEFCGWTEDPHGFMSGLDLFVVPSREEAFGLVVIEAMAAGVPVVASNIEGPREVLKSGRLGTMFESENVVSLAQAISSVFGHWPRSLKVAREAQDYALKTFGFEAGGRRLKQAVDTIYAQQASWTPKPILGLRPAAQPVHVS